jgi:cytochrome-b5 reductase
MAPKWFLSKTYVDGIYIPAGLLVLGTVIVKKEWAPFALLFAIALGTLKFFNSRMLLVKRHKSEAIC